MEPYWICFFSGIFCAWGTKSLPDPPGFSSVDPDGWNVALIYKGRKGKILLEILHYQFLLALALFIIEIVFLPIKWYFIILCWFIGINVCTYFLRFYRGLSRGDSDFWDYIDLLFFDSPIAAIISFLGIICLTSFVIIKWWLI